VARLQKYRGAERLADIRSPQIVADTAVGEATAGFGRQVRQSAGRVAQLGQRLQRRQAQIDRLETLRALRKIDAGVRQREEEERQSLPPGASGYTEAMLAHLGTEAESAVETLPQQLQEKVRDELAGRADAYSARFAAVEHGERQDYFRRGIAELTEELLAPVRDRPETVDEALAALPGLVDGTPLPKEERARLRQAGSDAIREAWISALPPAYRLSLLQAPGAEGVETASKTVQPLAGDLARIKDLPKHTLARLNAEAREALAVSIVEEEDRIAGQILSKGSGFDPEAIERSPVLPEDRKPQLQALLNEELVREEDERAALDWAGKTVAADPHSVDDAVLADRAYRRLTETGADADMVARSLLRTKRILPPAYLSRLRGSLESTDPDTVGKAHETLAGLFRAEPAAVRSTPRGRALGDAGARWRILKDLKGMSAEEASLQLAAANDPVRRQNLEEQYALQAGGRKPPHADTIVAMLARHRPYREDTPTQPATDAEPAEHGNDPTRPGKRMDT
jgi:hypothetical protein